MDAEAVAYAGVTSELEGLSAANFGTSMLAKGALTTSWNVENGISVENNESVFTLTLRAKRDAKLSDVLNISSAFTSAEAYNSAKELYNVSVSFEGTTAGEFALMQNQPNPFKDETVIGFSLPEAANVTLSIYDVSGKMLKVINEDYAKGYNQVSLNRSEINGAGVLYYMLETGEFSATKKMIIIE